MARTVHLGPLNVEIEQVDGSDIRTIEAWAAGICRDLTVGEVAEALGVDSSRSVVISALTDGLPADVRVRAEEICDAKLLDEPRT